MTTHNILNPFVPCHAQIFLSEGNRVNTYCMRERGHADEQVKGFPGGHNIVNAAPVAEVKGFPGGHNTVNVAPVAEVK